MGIGKMIGNLANAQGVSLKELSRKAGIPYTTLYSIVKRDSEKIKADALEKIAAELGQDEDTPLGFEAKRRKMLESDSNYISLTIAHGIKEARFIVPAGSRYEDHFHKYIDLDDSGRDAVDAVTETFLKINKKAPDFPSGEDVN